MVAQGVTLLVTFFPAIPGVLQKHSRQFHSARQYYLLSQQPAGPPGLKVPFNAVGKCSQSVVDALANMWAIHYSAAHGREFTVKFQSLLEITCSSLDKWCHKPKSTGTLLLADLSIVSCRVTVALSTVLELHYGIAAACSWPHLKWAMHSKKVMCSRSWRLLTYRQLTLAIRIFAELEYLWCQSHELDFIPSILWLLGMTSYDWSWVHFDMGTDTFLMSTCVCWLMSECGVGDVDVELSKYSVCMLVMTFSLSPRKCIFNIF